MTVTPARALLLALDYPPAEGGISRLLDAWIQDTERMEWRVITTTPGPESSSSRVIRTNLPGVLWTAKRKGAPWLRQAEDRFVVAGHPYLAGPALAAALLGGARSGCLTYGGELVAHNVRHKLALAPLRLVQRVIAISSYSADLAVQAGVHRKRVAVLRPELRASWMIESAPRRAPDEGLKLIAIARLSDGYKNLELLLRICAVLRPLGVVDKLTIVGGGPRLGPLREKAESLGIADVTDLPGHLPETEVHRRLADSSVGVFPSRDSIAERGSEGFGLVIGEMAAAGIPVLVGASGGAREAAAEPWASLLDPDDLWAWVDAVEQLYANEAKRVEMGIQALKWARSIDLERGPTLLASALRA